MQECGHEVTVFDWYSYQKKNGLQAMRTHILLDINYLKPDMVFMQIQGKGVIDVETAMDMSDQSFVVNWTGDVRSDIDWYKELAPHIGITLFSNQTDVDRMRSEGLEADYLQVGYDELIYNTEVPKGRGYPKIVFLGNNYIKSKLFPLSQERVDMVRYMQNRFKANFKVYGFGWVGAKRLLPHQEAQCYATSLIAINQNHFHYNRFSSDRILRAMACGAFMACKYYPGIELEFTMGKHLECWSTFQELEDICRYYLKNEEARKRIAMAGAQHVKENFRWHNRIEELVKIKEQYGRMGIEKLAI